jgi:hypothetical protein
VRLLTYGRDSQDSATMEVTLARGHSQVGRVARYILGAGACLTL